MSGTGKSSALAELGRRGYRVVDTDDPGWREYRTNVESSDELHRGEWLLVHWYAHSDGEAVRAISRVETDGDRLTRVRNYFYTPDVLAEICDELQVPFRSNGYRYWKPSREEA